MPIFDQTNSPQKEINMLNAIQKVHFSIAESDYYFKEILVNTLLTNPFYKLVKNCNNGHELASQLYTKQETVFLIDLYMPILSGIEVIKIIRQSGNETPIVAYSSTYQNDIFSLLKSLPNVYYCEKKSIVILDVLKNCVLNPLKNYDTYLQEWQAQPDVVRQYMERKQKGWYSPSLVEIQLMKLCYEGLSNKEMGQHLNLSTRTIETYIKRLTQKLGLRNKIDLIRFSVEQGYYNSST